jgi:DNA-binding transcriptional MocR family regulator
VLQDTRDASLVQLGTALPNTEALPTDRLRRIVAHVGQRHQRNGIRYEAPPGNRSLRVRIAKRALGAHCALGPDDILVTNSCQEALFLALSTVCRAGDMVAIESPAFFGVLRALERLELRVVEIQTHPRHGIELGDLADALRRHPIAACILVTNFSNPLGCHMPDENKRELVRLLTEREVPLVEDDIYGDLIFGDQRPSVAKAFDEKGLVILCSSFSKTIAPGYAVGWLSGGRFHEAISWNRTVINLTTAMLAQHVLDEFLAEGGYEHHLRKVRRLYAHQVANMAESIARHFPEGTRVSRPHGGFVLWVELPESCDSVELYRRAVAKGVTLAPGPIFAPGPGFRNFIRLSAAHWNPRVKAAIRTIGALVGGEL